MIWLDFMFAIRKKNLTYNTDIQYQCFHPHDMYENYQTCLRSDLLLDCNRMKNGTTQNKFEMMQVYVFICIRSRMNSVLRAFPRVFGAFDKCWSQFLKTYWLYLPCIFTIADEYFVPLQWKIKTRSERIFFWLFRRYLERRFGRYIGWQK